MKDRYYEKSNRLALRGLIQDFRNNPLKGPTVALREACRYGLTEDVNDLLEAGVDVNCCDESGDNPLMLACIGGNIDVIDVLVSAGCDVHARDNKGRTALMKSVAVFNREKTVIQIVKKLLDAGIDPTVVDDHGKSANEWIGNGRKYSDRVRHLLQSAGSTRNSDEVK